VRVPLSGQASISDFQTGIANVIPVLFLMFSGSNCLLKSHFVTGARRNPFTRCAVFAFLAVTARWQRGFASVPFQHFDCGWRLPGTQPFADAIQIPGRRPAASMKARLPDGNRSANAMKPAKFPR
jgi:hypothetical protein